MENLDAVGAAAQTAQQQKAAEDLKELEQEFFSFMMEDMLQDEIMEDVESE